MKNWKFLNQAWPAILWTVVIFVLMTIPGSSIPTKGLFGIPNLDKVVHIIMFGALVYLWSRYFIHKTRKRSVLLIICLMACLFGAGMEYYQKYFVPTRSFDVGDIEADAIGAILTWIYCRFYLYRKVGMS